MILMTIFSFQAEFSTKGDHTFTVTLLQNLFFALSSFTTPIPADSLYCKSAKFISPKHETLFSLDSTRD